MGSPLLLNEQKQQSVVLLMVKYSEQKSLCPPRAQWGWVVLLCMAMLGSWQLTAAPGFNATLDRNAIALGETVTLTLTFENCAPTSEPEIPVVANVKVAGSRSQQQMTIQNGNQTVAVTYDYDLRPAKEGDYAIGPIRVTLNTGQQAASKPLAFKVSRGSLPKTAGTPELAFVKLVIPRQQVYLGETIPVDIQCYCQQAANIQRPRLEASGFSMGTVTDYDKPYHQGQYAGQVYNQLVFHAPITPAKTGALTLGPASWSLSLLLGPRDFFGNFTQSRPVTVNSDPLEIQVLPLPTNGAPPDFNGAIGTFQIASFEVGPTNLAVGDPITLKIRISGSGSFNSVTLAQNQPEWREFKLYPPASKFEPTDPLETEGSKYFETVALPQNTAIKELPAFSFSFFDPANKTYRMLTSPAVPITVRPTAATPQPTVLSSAPPPTDTPPPAREIVHIKPALGKIGRAETPFILRPEFWALQAVMPLIWIGAVVWRRRRENLANNPRLVRQREVARLTRQGLKELPMLAKSNKRDEFYATVFRLLQEVLGERLELPASGITEAVLDGLNTAEKGSDALTSARELFQICNQYRYAPEHGGQELASLMPKIETTLAELQRVKPSSRGNGAVIMAGMLAGCLLPWTLHAEGKSLEVVSVPATHLTAEFTTANRLYEQGKYAEAATRYERLIQSGWNSSILYFNSGNAWFKAGQAGRAILAYRKAERISPRDPDIRANLQFARSETGNANSQLPGGRWARLLNRLTLNEWTVLAGSITSMFFVILTARQLGGGKKGLRAPIIVLGALSAGSIACLTTVAQSQLDDPLAVVIAADAVIRRGPFAESPSVTTARDGTELLVIDANNDWVEVTDAAKHTGWVPKGDVAMMK